MCISICVLSVIFIWNISTNQKRYQHAYIPTINSSSHGPLLWARETKKITSSALGRSPTCRQVWCACPQMLCRKREGFIYSNMSIDGQTQPSTSCCEMYFTMFDLLMMLEFGNHPLAVSANIHNRTISYPLNEVGFCDSA